MKNVHGFHAPLFQPINLRRLNAHAAVSTQSGMSGFTPSLHVVEVAGRVRLRLAGIGYADGPTLQDAADELVRKLLLMAMALRSGAIGPVGFGFRPDPAALDFLWELGQVAAAGGDIRERLFDATAFAA